MRGKVEVFFSFDEGQRQESVGYSDSVLLMLGVIPQTLF